MAADFDRDDMTGLVASLACFYLGEPDDRPDYEDGTHGTWRAPRDINNGACGDFAETLCGILADNGVLDAVPLDGACVAHVKEGIHCWTWWRGRHYDAEAPEGVEDWRDLPFWHRYVTNRARSVRHRCARRRHVSLSDLRKMLSYLAATWVRVRTEIRRERVA